LTSVVAKPPVSVACLAQKCTTPVALTPKSLTLAEPLPEPDPELLHAVSPSAVTAAAAIKTWVPLLLIIASLQDERPRKDGKPLPYEA
jgi:hypothetical protein